MSLQTVPHAAPKLPWADMLPHEAARAAHGQAASLTLYAHDIMCHDNFVILSAQGEVDTDSIGNVICRKAVEVDAAAVVMASHTRSKLTEFVLGSVTNYCTCAPPARRASL